VTRGSDSFVWGVRWETIEQFDGQPLYAVLLPEIYPSLGDAQRVQQRLTEMRPLQPHPVIGGEPRPVRYVVFARQQRVE
jgi:hypothetical protein